MTKKPVSKKPKFNPVEVPVLLSLYRTSELASIPASAFIVLESVASYPVSALIYLAHISETTLRPLSLVTPLEARDELLFRFQRLTSSLVKVCLTGRYSSFNRSQIPFLRLFSNKDLEGQAARLKTELAGYEPDELFRTGQLAILQAIERTEKNLAATVTTCFKDLIFSMIKGQDSHKSEPLEFVQVAVDSGESRIILESLISDLPEGDWLLVQRLLEGEQVDLPAPLIDRMKQWFPEHC